MTRTIRRRDRLSTWFAIEQRGSTPLREVAAGFTTFGAMSYILAVNPAVLAAAGMDHAQLITVTALAAAFGTLLMALWANLPIALAPAMGNNIIFAQVVVLRLGLSFRIALALVFLNALIFIALALSGWRERIVRAIPDAIRIGIQGSLGFFIAWLGLKNAGLAVIHEGSVTFAGFHTPAVAFAYAALLVTVLAMAARLPLALLASIVLFTVLGIFIPDGTGSYLTVLPHRPVATPIIPADLFLALDPSGLFARLDTILPILLFLLINDFFGVTATLVGVTRTSGLSDANGQVLNGREAYAADGVASAVGALLGTSTMSVYVESATGIGAGGRTGLTSLVVGILFAASIFLWPLLIAIPPQAVAPALVMVGILMLAGLGDIDFRRPEDSYPPILMVILTACTTDLIVSLASGVILYAAIAGASRQWQRLNGILLTLVAVLLLYLLLSSRVI